MQLICNVPLRQKSEQDRLRVLWERIERERLARVRALEHQRALKSLCST